MLGPSRRSKRKRQQVAALQTAIITPAHENNLIDDLKQFDTQGPNIEHPTSNIQRPTSNTRHPTPDTLTWPSVVWQGLGFRLPADCNPMEISGSRAKGRMRIGNLHRTTMEMIWQAPGWFNSGKQVWKRYWKQLGIKPAQVSELLSDSPIHLEQIKKGHWQYAKVMRLESDGIKSIHMLALAPFSGRFVLIRMPLTPQPEEDAGVGMILETLHEADPKEMETWSIYGLSVQVPSGSELTQSQLRPGHLSLKFHCRRMQIAWERVSFGNRNLKGRSLTEWLAERYKPRRKRVSWQPGPDALRGGCTLERPLSPLRKLLPTHRRKIARIAAWHENGPDQIVILMLEGATGKVDQILPKVSQTWQVQSD